MFIEQRQVGPMAVFAYLIGDEAAGEADEGSECGDGDEPLGAAGSLDEWRVL